MKKIIDLFANAWGIYFVITILFFILAYNKNEFYFWANDFSVGFFALIFTIIGIILHKYRKKKKKRIS